MSETKAKEWFYDCPQCGEIGRVSELNEHPTRPCAMDIGFCPHCGGEVDEFLDRAQITVILDEYGEDPEAFLDALAQEPQA